MKSERKSSSWHSWVYLWLLWISFEWWSCRSNEYPDTRNDVCVWWQQSAIWSKKSELNMFLPDTFWQKKKAGVVNRRWCIRYLLYLRTRAKAQSGSMYWMTQGPDGRDRNFWCDPAPYHTYRVTEPLASPDPFRGGSNWLHILHSYAVQALHLLLGWKRIIFRNCEGTE